MATFIKKIGSKGELVIPKCMRKAEGLDANTRVRIFRTDGAIIIVPLKKSFRDLAGLFGKGGVNHKELDDLMFEVMAAT